MKSVIVLGENFVNQNCALAVSSEGSDMENIYDQDQATQWASSGSSEGAGETLQIDFKDRNSGVINRIIDRLILLNTNFAKFKIEYWDGTQWVLISESDFTTTPNISGHVYIEIVTPITTQKLLITVTNTLAASAEKTLGEFKACLHLLDLRYKVAFSRSNWDNGGNYRLDSGSLVVYTNIFKVEAGVQIAGLSLADYEIIAPEIMGKHWMTWILYEDFRRADIYELAAVNYTESIDRKMGYFNLQFSVKER